MLTKTALAWRVWMFGLALVLALLSVGCAGSPVGAGSSSPTATPAAATSTADQAGNAGLPATLTAALSPTPVTASQPGQAALAENTVTLEQATPALATPTSVSKPRPTISDTPLPAVGSERLKPVTDTPTPALVSPRTPTPSTGRTSAGAAATLRAGLLASLAKVPTLTPRTGAPSGPNLSDVAVARLDPAPLAMLSSIKPGLEYWIGYSTGTRVSYASDDPGQSHFVALFSRDPASDAADPVSFREIGRLALPSADYVDPTGVRQVPVGSGRLFIEVVSGIGAHSGAYDLLSFDGRVWRIELSSMNSSPGAGWTAPYLADGLPAGELDWLSNNTPFIWPGTPTPLPTTQPNFSGRSVIVLNDTDPYVFCYACGVRAPGFRVLRWTDSKFVEIHLGPAGASVPAETRKLVDDAVALAKGGLWKDARAEIDQAHAQQPGDVPLAWDAALIHLYAQAAAENVKGGFPILGNVIFGDYAVALALFRGTPADQIFDPSTPLIADTPAASFEKELSAMLATEATAAIAARPNLAAAYYLRAWGAYLANPADPAVVADLTKAKNLDPAEPLYTDALKVVNH